LYTHLVLLACAGWYLFMSFMALDAHMIRLLGVSPLRRLSEHAIAWIG
jgi:hypothetical protein